MNTLSNLIDRLSTARVLCVGDVMLDRYISGSVDRISPEAPIPILRIEHETEMLGGAGNVVANVTALGGTADFITVIGTDSAGREVTALLDAQDTIASHLLTEDARCTSLKTRFVGAGQQMMRADAETTHPLSAETEALALKHIADTVSTCAVLILSDYGKGVLSDNLIAGAIELAHAAGCKVIVDPKGNDYTRYRGADLITPNTKELIAATAMSCDGDSGIVRACEHLIDTCGLGGVLATRSADGMTLMIKGEEPCHLSAEAREVFDVSGAGDTVVATLALAWATGASVEDAARLANTAAGIVVAKSGTATVSAAELSRALHHEDLGHAEAKLFDLTNAQIQAVQWRDQGLRIGFTNGCFDLLHPGHISLLSQARSFCDRLIVGLNSDSSVRVLKGDTRPVQSEAARAAVLGALTAVDMVVVFGEDTPIELIETLRPDVLVKGADYTMNTVVGADIVHSYGGRVVLADLVDGQSTTSIIERSNS